MRHAGLSESYYPIRDDERILDTTVGGLLRQAARTNPHDPALIEVDESGALARRWTFAALLSDAQTLALCLSTRFAPGERVCVWAPNLPEWVLMEYACGLAGLTLVTANPAYQAEELRFVLEQSRSCALFLTRAYRGNPMWEIAAEATRDLPALREVTDIEDSIAVQRTGQRAAGLPQVSPDDPAQIQYTSGTTGFPKGAVLSHRSLTNNARFFAQRLDVPRGAPWANVMPLFHTAGCGMYVLGAMQSGAPLYLFGMFDAATCLRVMARERIVIGGGVPTMVVAMLEVLKDQGHDLSALKRFVCGGSMVPPALIEAMRAATGCSIQTVYGQTECAPLITQHDAEETLEDAANTVGRPLPQTEVAIRDPQTGAVVPVGETGELCARGYLTMIEYNDNPEATAGTLDSDGWLKTGDLGRMDARGYVAITGRVKEMIIRGGENLFPAEIENVLLEHPDVAEVAVVGIPDERWGEVVAAFLRPSEGRPLDPGELKAHCRAHLAAMKSPAIWCTVDEFPMTGSGKIRKFELRDRYLAGDISELPPPAHRP